MKTETQIAQENIEKIKRFDGAYEDWNNESLPVKEVEEAQKLVDELTDKWEDSDTITRLSKTHKATCQRFLEFLEKFLSQPTEHYKIDKKQKPVERMFVRDFVDNKVFPNDIKEKITDLKNAIKLYEDAGI